MDGAGCPEAIRPDFEAKTILNTFELTIGRFRGGWGSFWDPSWNEVRAYMGARDYSGASNRIWGWMW